MSSTAGAMHWFRLGTEASQTWTMTGSLLSNTRYFQSSVATCGALAAAQHELAVKSVLPSVPTCLEEL